MVTIAQVEKGSAADKAGILPGDTLIAIDDHPIKDVLDYRFFLTEKRITLRLLRENTEFSVVLHKGQYDDIGLDFDTFLMDQKRRCANRCIFCFIDQNPCGMRETVYFKDDDTRLSFLMGNYVTLTNVSNDDLKRICQMHLSPVNVSVHTTNPELRVKMLGNPKAGRILDQLTLLKDGGIDLNCQIVACRGINDGKELERTLTDLTSFLPCLKSIAVVPAGLTAHRKGLYPLQGYDKTSAREVIAIVERYATRFMKEFDEHLVFAADEFYLYAQLPLPQEKDYDGYPQLDNGVGLLRSSREELLDEIAYRRECGQWDNLPKKDVRITVATGTAAAGLLEEIGAKITENLPFVHLEIVPIINRFFGESVTVAGLICGQDMIEQLREKKPQILFFPAVSLRHERDRFLDDTTPEQVRDALGCPVYPIENGTPLLDAIEQVIRGE